MRSFGPHIFVLICFWLFGALVSAAEADDCASSWPAEAELVSTPDTLVLNGIGDTLAEAQPDSVKAVGAAVDTAAARRGWVEQLIASGFKINDPSIRYPRFARFCVNVYNWGDRTFNSYDPEYVVGTGKNWKLFFHNDMWGESYSMIFRDLNAIRMHSKLYDDLGGTISFMAVSLDYSVNARTIFEHTQENRKRFNFNFVCALFSANLTVSSNNGGAKITRFGKYEPVKKHNYDLHDIHSKTTTLNAFYIFNHRRYSHAAAYCYSKYQLKSAGSWLLGGNYTTQNIDIDFSGLPKEMLDYLPTDQKKFVFDYRDISVSGGYGQSWVLKPRKWLINLTVMPSLGWRHSYDTSTDDRRDFISGSMHGLFSVVYNHRSLYAALKGNIRAHFYFSRSFTFANTTMLMYTTVGMRF